MVPIWAEQDGKTSGKLRAGWSHTGICQPSWCVIQLNEGFLVPFVTLHIFQSYEEIPAVCQENRPYIYLHPSIVWATLTATLR